MEVVAEGGLDDGRVLAVGVDEVGEESAYAWEAVGLIEDGFDGIAESLACVVHFVEEVES